MAVELERLRARVADLESRAVEPGLDGYLTCARSASDQLRRLVPGLPGDWPAARRVLTDACRAGAVVPGSERPKVEAVAEVVVCGVRVWLICDVVPGTPWDRDRGQTVIVRAAAEPGTQHIPGRAGQ